MLDESPRVLAQRRRIEAAFGAAIQPHPLVIQRAGAGRYRTTGKGRLRNEDTTVLADVTQGTLVDVTAGARTSRFKLGWLSSEKDHTWVTCRLGAGWLRDEILGNPLPVEAPRPAAAAAAVPASAAAPPATAPARVAPGPVRATATRPIGVGPARSRPIGIGGAAPDAEPPSTITLPELEEYRTSEDDLEHPGVATGAQPLGLGRPHARREPADFRIVIRGGQLYERSGRKLLKIHKSPFVLTLSGQLFGGQGEGSTEMASMTMESHAMSEVGAPAWAGELAAEGGKVTYLNNRSGTFMLHDRANINIVKFLYRHAVLSQDLIETLEIDRVYVPGLDREGKLAPHAVVR